MARRRPSIEVEITEGAIRVRRDGRLLTIPTEPPSLESDDEADFVIRLDGVEHWDAPDDDTPIDIVELQMILEAVEEQAERHGLTVAFD
jgi:hypothetical protein